MRKRILISLLVVFECSSPICLKAFEPQLDSLLSRTDMQLIMAKKKKTELELIDKNGRMYSHVIRRGETWESIAAQYGTTVSDLKAINPFIEGCYTGMEIIVPITISDLQISSNNYTIKDSRYVRAGEFLLNDNYAKARKLYTEIIKTGNAHPIAYYNRGICNFELGKYSECYADMEHVIEADPNNETFEDVFIIQNEAQVKIQELHEKGNETWGNFLLALNSSLYNGIQAYQQSKMMMNRQNTFTPQIGGNLVGGSWNPELAAAGINPPAFISENYLQNQVSMKMQEVEEKVIKDAEYFKRMYRLNHPYADENTVNSAYGNYVNDCANINNGSNIDSSSSSESSPKDSNTSQTKQRYGYKNCHICKGSGICQTCKGHKVVENYGKLSECPNCELENMKRTGKCSRCHGSGQVYGIN